jgi:hypothetical protein
MIEHPPRHLLEAFLADVARLANASELRAHLAVCERCSERLHAMDSARAAFAREHSASDFARRVSAAAALRERPRRAWLWAAGGGGLALALAALVLLIRVPSDPEIRYRGAAVSFEVYVRDGTRARALKEGEVLSAGGQLAFTYTLGAPQHLLLFGIDDAGTITRYFPDGNIVQSSALTAGSKRQLPVGIELDARSGRERLIALFTASPLDEAAARAAIEDAWRQVRARGKGPSEPFELALPATQRSLWFDKR